MSNGAKKDQRESDKMKQLYRSICECGARNPQFNGYCESCLKSLKNRYETYYKEYKEKSYEYEKMMFAKFNQKEKMLKLRNRINNFKDVQPELETKDSDLPFKDLEEKNIKR
jgi:hypothetical protein